MDVSLIGKNALVCGSSKGIGRSIAMELASLGASVTLAARSADLLAEIVTKLPNTVEQKHGFLIVDMLNTDDLVRKVHNLALTKPIHILINNSGGPAGGAILEAKHEEFSKAMHAHLHASHRLVKLLVDGMKNEGYGRIVNIISTSVKEPIEGLGVSNTTRGPWQVGPKRFHLSLLHLVLRSTTFYLDLLARKGWNL